jgi:Flp pilus assembly protein TadG
MLMISPTSLRLRRRGVATIEFGLIAPALLTLMIGVFDIGKILILQQEVWNTAHSVSLTASWLATQTLSTAGVNIPNDFQTVNGQQVQEKTISGTTTLTQAQVQAVESDIYAEIPWLRSGVEHGNFFVTLSGVQFSAFQIAHGVASGCTPYQNCTNWIPFVTWSVPYKGNSGLPGTPDATKTRTCGPVLTATNIADTTPLTSANLLTSLRTNGITYPDPILVADVSYTYTPAFPFWRFISGPITLVATAYWPVRAIPFNADSLPSGQQMDQLTLYDLAYTDTDTTHHCPGSTYPGST